MQHYCSLALAAASLRPIPKVTIESVVAEPNMEPQITLIPAMLSAGEVFNVGITPVERVELSDSTPQTFAQPLSTREFWPETQPVQIHYVAPPRLSSSNQPFQSADRTNGRNLPPSGYLDRQPPLDRARNQLPPTGGHPSNGARNPYYRRN
jgi:hypothetical protein